VGDATSVDAPENTVPGTFSLSQNFPNPFNPVTTVEFSLPKRTAVLLRIFNLNGEEVITLIDKVYDAGHHKASWDANDFPAGIYFYRIHAGPFSETRKLILLK
jgi:hypothetical protein